MLEISPSALLVLLTSTISLSLYLLSIKKYPLNKFSLFFWTHLFTYGFFAFFVILHEFFLEQEHLQAVHEFMTEITLTNLPFYFLEGLITIGSIILMKELMSISTMTVVISFTQINVLFTTIGVFLLGNPTSMKSFIGILIIFFGALIAGLKKYSFNVFKDRDPQLFKLGSIYALLQAARIWIAYLCTAKMNPTTHGILQTLNKHLQIIPFAPMTPLHFNMAVQVIIVVSLFLYIRYYLREPESIMNGIKNHYKIIIILSILYTGFLFLYLKSFSMVQDKEIIIGINKIFVPITALLGYYFYQTQPSKQTILGISIIMLGSLYTIFA